MFTTLPNLRNNDLYILEPYEGRRNLRVMKAISLRENLPSGLVLCMDTTKKNFREYTRKLYGDDRIASFQILDQEQNIFFASTPSEFDNLAMALYELIPYSVRSRKSYPKSVDSITDLKPWRHPNTFAVRDINGFLDHTREAIGPMINELYGLSDEYVCHSPLKNAASMSSAEYMGQIIEKFNPDGSREAWGVVYVLPDEVSVDRIGIFHTDIWQYGVDPDSHNIILRKF